MEGKLNAAKINCCLEFNATLQPGTQKWYLTSNELTKPQELMFLDLERLSYIMAKMLKLHDLTQ